MARNKKSGCGSWLFRVFLVMFAVSMLTNFLDKDPGNTSKPITTTPSYTTQQTIGSQTELPEDRWIEAQLNVTERKIYNGMVTALAGGKLECQVDDVQTDNLKDVMSRVVRAVIFEHPEFFWFGGSYSYSKRSSLFGGQGVHVTMYPYDYWTYTSDAQGYIDRLNDRVYEIAKEAKKYPTQYEQVLFVHDYIVGNVDYNHEAADETTSTVRKASSEQSYSAYGCLVNHSAICGGYSKGFQLMMTALGIECIYVKGEAGGLHAWNCVKIDGEYYLFDTTWDDPGPKYDDGTLRYPHEVTYTYFGMTSEQMGRTHTPLDYFSFPVCTATDYNYYKHEGLYLDTADMKRIDKVLQKQTDTQIPCVAFSDNAYAQARAKVIDDRGYHKLDALKDEDFAYIADDDNRVLKFFLDYD